MGQLKQMLRAQILAEMTYDRQMSDEEIAELIDRRMDACMEEQPEEFDLTIHQCLWHDTCVSCGCPEVCRFFCECDNYAFGDLKKVGFRRTQTLGTGGDCCNFHFYKK